MRRGEPLLHELVPGALVALVLVGGAASACHPGAGLAVYGGGYLDGTSPVFLRLSFPPCDGPVLVRVQEAALGGPEVTSDAPGLLTFVDGFHGCVSGCDPLPPAADFFLEVDTPAEPSYFVGAYANPHYAFGRLLLGGFHGEPASLALVQA